MAVKKDKEKPATQIIEEVKDNKHHTKGKHYLDDNYDGFELKKVDNRPKCKYKFSKFRSGKMRILKTTGNR
jgi:hypothetical protein